MTPEEVIAEQNRVAEADLAKVKANLPTVSSRAVPAFSPQNDGWEDAAKENDGRLIQGQRLNFSDGSWSVGKEATVFDMTRRLIAFGILTAWVKWEDQRPSRLIVKQPGQPFPEREDLDDRDEEKWPKGPSGDKVDPWRRTLHLYFADEKTSAGFTYAASSWGAKSAISDLATTIRNHRFKEPGALPVVTLSSAPHKTKFGMKKKPAFEIVGWTGGGIADGSPSANGGGPGGDVTGKQIDGKAVEPATIVDDGKAFDDVVPF